MILSIENTYLKLEADTLGGQMHSIRSAKGTEYLWTGDPEYWDGQAPNLFPYVGRMTDKSYTVEGKLYHMDIHGFASSSEMEPVEQTKTRLVFCLRDNEETRKQYPFAFEYQVAYELEGPEIVVTYRVKNLDTRVMPFGIGAHPGFRVPFAQGKAFEDYYLEFPCSCHPERVCYSADCFVEETKVPFVLEENRRLRLRHDLFDQDAIVLCNVPRKVCLRAKDCDASIEVSYPGMSYLGLWHMPKTKAPYICIEPWVSQPSRKGIVEELYSQSDLIQLTPGEIYRNEWKIRINE